MMETVSLTQIRTIEDVQRMLKDTEIQKHKLEGEMGAMVSDCQGWVNDPSIVALLAQGNSLNSIQVCFSPLFERLFIDGFCVLCVDGACVSCGCVIFLA
jgi:hypothetical protein